MVGIPVIVFCSILCRYLFFSYLPEKRFCSRRYSLGGCFCFRNSFYRYVADDKKESGELVLVGRYQYSFYTFVFCKTLCVYQCVLFDIVNICFLGIGRMAEKSQEAITTSMKKGLVIGKFMPFHKGHKALIDFAMRNCDELIVLICAEINEPIPAAQRYMWLKEALNNHTR